jgi:uncharacterized membrane protein (DUF373 family)
MNFLRAIWAVLTRVDENERFLRWMRQLEGIVAKTLSLLMVIVILIAIADLGIFLARELWSGTIGSLSNILFKLFGLFLNVLIALEILENITAYLDRKGVQADLVIVTSLIAVARKIIVLKPDDGMAITLIELAVAVFALSISYWIVRQITPRETGH